MTLDGVIPIANIQRSSWTKSNIDRYETQVSGENEIALILLHKAVLLLDPFMDLHSIVRLVAHFDETTLEFLRPKFEVDEFDRRSGVRRRRR